MAEKPTPKGFNPAEAPRQPSPDKVHAEPLTIQIGDKEYKLGRIRLSDIAAATARLRSLRLRALLAEQAGMSWRVAAPALAHAACMDPTDEDVWQFIESSAEGTAYILWRVMNRHNPGLTLERTEELLEEAPEIVALLFMASELQRPRRMPEGEQRENPTEADASPKVFRRNAESATGPETPPSSRISTDGPSMKSPTLNGPSTSPPSDAAKNS